MVVVTIIAILLATILLASEKATRQARAMACLSNQRQLALAINSYADDNADRIPSPRTDTGDHNTVLVGTVQGAANAWVSNNASGALVVLDGVRYETTKALESGSLWTYMSESAEGYVSPMDPTGRVRSYSMNSFIGSGGKDQGARADDYWDFPDLSDASISPAFRGTRFDTTVRSKIPEPSRTFATITERNLNVIAGLPSDYNEMGFCIRVAPPAAAPGSWIDVPATWNTGRINISYLDGSIDAPPILYEELALRFEQQGSGVIETGTRPAFRFMTTILLPGVIPQDVP